MEAYDRGAPLHMAWQESAARHFEAEQFMAAQAAQAEAAWLESAHAPPPPMFSEHAQPPAVPDHVHALANLHLEPDGFAAAAYQADPFAAHHHARYGPLPGPLQGPLPPMHGRGYGLLPPMHRPAYGPARPLPHHTALGAHGPLSRTQVQELDAQHEAAWQSLAREGSGRGLPSQPTGSVCAGLVGSSNL